jgi:hypothetical protein
MSIQKTGPIDREVVPLVVKPKSAWKMLACSNTHGYELLNAGELESFLDGRARKITVESIRGYIVRRLAPANGRIKEDRPRRRRRPRKPQEPTRHEP